MQNLSKEKRGTKNGAIKNSQKNIEKKGEGPSLEGNLISSFQTFLTMTDSIYITV